MVGWFSANEATSSTELSSLFLADLSERYDALTSPPPGTFKAFARSEAELRGTCDSPAAFANS